MRRIFETKTVRQTLISRRGISLFINNVETSSHWGVAVWERTQFERGLRLRGWKWEPVKYKFESKGTNICLLSLPSTSAVSDSSPLWMARALRPKAKSPPPCMGGRHTGPQATANRPQCPYWKTPKIFQYCYQRSLSIKSLFAPTNSSHSPLQSHIRLISLHTLLDIHFTADSSYFYEQVCLAAAISATSSTSDSPCKSQGWPIEKFI